jgi:hypothetical protein
VNVKIRCTAGLPEPVSLKLAPFTGIIDAIFEANKQIHAQQRHTAFSAFIVPATFVQHSNLPI